ncbi:MAG: hypothetical protein SynsKO_03820 [Synoicihabitans sp.]
MPTSRRKFFGYLLGGLGLGAVVTWWQKSNLLRWMIRRNRNEGLNLSVVSKIGDGPCVLTPEQVEGPFFIAAPHRSNLKEDRVGRDLGLEIQVVRMPDCSPVAGAIVEIWQCDAEGNYSGYPEGIGHDIWKTMMLAGTGKDNVSPTNEARYLRGAQISDNQGIVRFDTIVPGWYEPRTPHIHFKIISDQDELLTSQFYFDPETMDRIYTSVSPYTQHGPSPYRPENDVVISIMPDVAGLQLGMTGEDDEPLRATAKVGIAAPT